MNVSLASLFACFLPDLSSMNVVYKLSCSLVSSFTCLLLS